MNPNSPWQPAGPSAQALSMWGAAAAPARPQIPQGDGPALSFNPKTFTEGGMIDNVWVRFSNARAGIFDYKGKQEAAPAVLYDLVIVDAQTQQPIPGAQPQEKAWTVGKLSDYLPRPNGVQFYSPSGKQGFNKSSNWATFCRAAVAAGIPETVFDNGQVDALNGLVAFVQIVKGADRGGMKDAQGNTKGDTGTLVITQVPGGARVQVAAAPAPLGAPAPMGHAPAPMGGQMPQAQAQAPMPQFQPQVPAQAPAPMAPPTGYAQPMAQPQPQPTANPAPAAQGPNRNAAAQMLARILQTNPQTKQAFQVALFREAMMDEPMRNLISSPQFQAEVIGQPINLP